MSWIEVAINAATSGGLGAVLGTVGSYFQKKQENSHEFAMRQLDLQAIDAEMAHTLAVADKNLQITEKEGDIAIERDELAAFLASQQAGQKSSGIKWVDAWRESMRPGLTLLLLIAQSVLIWQVHKLIGGLEQGLPTEIIGQLYLDFAHNISFLFLTAVTWWFGTRPHTKFARG